MNKINQLLKKWPQGTVKSAAELNKDGYKTDLLNRYLRSSWLESLGYGAYKLANDKVEWYGALYALQKQTGLNIHPGGRTALGYKGYLDNLPNEDTKTQLFGGSKENLPKWFKDQSWMGEINYVQTNLFDYSTIVAFTAVELKNIRIMVSTPELAALEMLHLVPMKETFDEAFKIFEGLTALRFRMVQKLLAECNSIKVKRLFLYMAEKNNHPWFNELNPGEINLGSGKREIVKNGTLDKKYNITVPRTFAE